MSVVLEYSLHFFRCNEKATQLFLALQRVPQMVAELIFSATPINDFLRPRVSKRTSNRVSTQSIVVVVVVVAVMDVVVVVVITSGATVTLTKFSCQPLKTKLASPLAMAALKMSARLSTSTTGRVSSMTTSKVVVSPPPNDDSSARRARRDGLFDSKPLLPLPSIVNSSNSLPPLPSPSVSSDDGSAII